MKIYSSSLILFALSAAANTPLFCADTHFCIYSRQIGATVEITIETLKQIRYAGFGFGTSMSNAQVYFAYLNSDNTVSLYQARSSGRNNPSATAITLQKSNPIVNVAAKTFSISFIKSIAPSSADQPQVTLTNSQNMIWSYCDNCQGQVPKFTGSTPSLAFHTQFGEVSSVQLLSNNFVPTAYNITYGTETTSTTTTTTTTPVAATTTKGNQTTTNQTSSVSFPSTTATNDIIFNGETQNLVPVMSPKTYMIYIHGIMFFLAWFVFAPFGYYAAKFFKVL